MYTSWIPLIVILAIESGDYLMRYMYDGISILFKSETNQIISYHTTVEELVFQ